MFNCVHLHTELTSTSHVKPPVTTKAQCRLHSFMCNTPGFNFNCKLVSCVTHPRDIHHRKSGCTKSLAPLVPTTPIRRSNTQYTKHYNSHKNWCILFRSHCYVIQTSLIMATAPKHVAQGQNNLLVIWKFGLFICLRCSTCHWLHSGMYVHILSSLLKMPKAQKLLDCVYMILCDSNVCR
jgi:hypothetical protein